MAKRRRRKRRPRQGAKPPGPAPPSAVQKDDAQRATASARRADSQGPPPPPWGSFPLSEIVVAIGILFLVAGLFVSPPRGTVMIGVGIALASLAGLELAVREHFAGYRSHTLLLAAAVGTAVIAGLFALDPGALPPLVRLIVGAAAAGLAAVGLLSAFRRRAGGAMFKVR